MQEPEEVVVAKQRNPDSTGVQTLPGRTGNRGLPDTDAIVQQTVAHIIAQLPSSTVLTDKQMQKLEAAVKNMAASSSRTDSLVTHAFTTYQDVADSMIKQLTQQILAGGLDIQPEAIAAQTLMGVQLTNASLAQVKADIAKKKLRSALELWNEPEPEPAPKPRAGPAQPSRRPKPKPF